MTRFRKKPDEIEAVPWTGSNWHQVLEFCGKGNVTTDGEHVYLTDDPSGQRPVKAGMWIVRDPHEMLLRITTDEVIRRDWEQVQETDLHMVPR
jgi:hypothetical protein